MNLRPQEWSSWSERTTPWESLRPRHRVGPNVLGYETRTHDPPWSRVPRGAPLLLTEGLARTRTVGVGTAPSGPGPLGRRRRDDPTRTEGARHHTEGVEGVWNALSVHLNPTAPSPHYWRGPCPSQTCLGTRETWGPQLHLGPIGTHNRKRSKVDNGAVDIRGPGSRRRNRRCLVVHTGRGPEVRCAVVSPTKGSCGVVVFWPTGSGQ